MKKIIFNTVLFAFAFLSIGAYSQETGAPTRTWADPLDYTLDQPVTWYFDMTGTSFVDGQDLYMWAWSPSEPDAGHFAHSSEFAKLEYVGSMVWKKTLTPTLYFSKTVAEIKASPGFWMRLKGLTDVLQSGVFKVEFGLPPIPKKDPEVSIFPRKFCQLDIISIFRKYNEKTTTTLTYTIVAGSKTITGAMAGNQAEMKVIVNLMSSLGNEPSIDKIKLIIKNESAVEVSNTDFPVVPLTEVE